VRRRRTAASYATNDFAVSANGSNPLTDTSGSVPTGLTELLIGTALNTELNGTIRRLTYWPTRLPNETLQTITQ
jgi:hypothetical protein